MKIIIFNENWVYGGNNLYIENLINFLSDYNYEVELILNNEGIYNKDKIPNTVKVSRFNTLNATSFVNNKYKNSRLFSNLYKYFVILRPIIFLINICRFYFFLKKKNLNLVISCNGGYPAAESCISLIVASYLLKIKNIFCIASMPKDRKYLLLPYELLLDKALNFTCDIITTVSNAQMNELILKRGNFRSKKIILNNGIKDDLRNEKTNYFTSKVINLGVISRLDKDKSISTLVHLASKLKKEKFNFHLYIIGTGPEINNIKKLTKDLCLDNEITITGYVENTKEYLLNIFDIYLFPSLLEGLPYSILEAMKYSLPIITTPAGGITEAIKNMENGLIVDKNSILSFYNATKLLIENKDLAIELGRNAKQTFKEKFTIEIMNTNIKNMIKYID